MGEPDRASPELEPDESIQHLLEVLSSAYQGPSWHGKTLRELVSDVSAAEAAARPAGVAHSIGTLVAHAALWKEVITARLNGQARTVTDPAENFPPVPADAWEATRNRLEVAHQELRDRVRTLDPTIVGRDLAAGDPPTAALQVLGVAHHDLYHAGQVAVIKRMLRGG